MSRLNDIEKLRGWCHKILPLVYDDSLSYYEVLCKVRAKINEVIDLTAEQNEVIEETVQEVTDWETTTDGKYDEFTRQINQDFDDFKSAVNDDIADYKGDMVDLYNEFLQDYLQDLGIEQTEGQQTDKVMSQKATTDALAGKVDTSAVKQVTGTSTTDVMSQKAVTDELATKVNNSEVKQSTGQSVSDIMSQKATTDALAGKVDTSAVKQATGSSTTDVMSQKATTDELAGKVDTTAVKQTTGVSTTYIMSQKAITENLENILDKQEIAPAYKQVFNKFKVVDSDYKHIRIQSNNQMVTNNNYYTIKIPYNVLVGDILTMNFVDKNSECSFNVLEIATGNADLVAGNSAIEQGSVSTANKRGSMTATSTASYIYVAVEMSAGDYHDAFDCLVVSVNRSVNKGTYNEYYENQNETVQLVKQQVSTGDDLSSNLSVFASTGWTGDFTNGYTHESGTNALGMGFGGFGSTPFLVSFDCTGVNEGDLHVRIGDNNYPVDIYNGTTHFNIAGISTTNALLYFIPTNTFTGTITNIKVYEIGAGYNLKTISNANYGTQRNYKTNLSGFWNTAVGESALQSCQNATRNVAIGLNALRDIKSGNRNVGVGTFALAYLKTGERNIAMGSDSLWQATNASDCVAIGKGSMSQGSDISRNIAIGSGAMGSNGASAKDCIAIGYTANNYAQGQNVCIGHRSSYYTRGTGIVSIGYNAYGQLYVGGNNNTFVGNQTGSTEGTSPSDLVEVENSTAIGNGAKVTASNQVVLGNTSVSELIFGNKKIIFNLDGTVTWESV